MSFSDPVRIIDHIPQDFDMKANHKRRRYKQPVQPRAEAHTKAQPAKAPEPFLFHASAPDAFGRSSPSSAHWQSSPERSSLDHGVTNEDFD